MSNERSCGTCKGAGHRFSHPDATGEVTRETCAACHGSGLANPTCTECEEPLGAEKPHIHCGLPYHSKCFATMLDQYDGVCVAYAEAGEDGCVDCSVEQAARKFDADYDAMRDAAAMRAAS